MRGAVDAVEQLWGPPAVSPRFGYADIWNADDPPAEGDLRPAPIQPGIVGPEALWDAEPEPPASVLIPAASEPATESATSGPDVEPPDPSVMAPRPRYVLPDTFFAVSPKARSWRERLSALGISLTLLLALRVTTHL